MIGRVPAVQIFLSGSAFFLLTESAFRLCFPRGTSELPLWAQAFIYSLQPVNMSAGNCACIL